MTPSRTRNVARRAFAFATTRFRVVYASTIGNGSRKGSARNWALFAFFIVASMAIFTGDLTLTQFLWALISLLTESK